jgi:hypothetical protein
MILMTIRIQVAESVPKTNIVFVAVLPVSILRKPPTKALLHQSYSRRNPKKYVGEKDSERTPTVHMFISQLSPYLRLATNVDVDKDITEYVLGFLDGFASQDALVQTLAIR